MSKTPLVLIAGLLGAAFACAPAFAQGASPFGAADCREAHLDRVADGSILSSEPVIVCKRTDRTAALLTRTRPAPPPAVRPEPPAPAHVVDHVAFNGHQSDRECAMLNCPTFILTGVGD